MNRAEHIEQQIRAKLQADLEQEDHALQIHLAIARALKRFEGKKLTKRSKDAIEAEVAPLFPSHPQIWFPHPGQCSVWHAPSIPYDNRLVFYICPHTPSSTADYKGSWVGEFHLEGFEYSDQCHGRAVVERNAQRRQLLDEHDPTIAGVAKRIAQLREDWSILRSILNGEDTLRYATSDLIGLKEDRTFREEE